MLGPLFCFGLPRGPSRSTALRKKERERDLRDKDPRPYKSVELVILNPKLTGA